MPTAQNKQDSEASELLDFITYRISQVHPKLNAQAAHILKNHAGLSLLQWRTIALLKAIGPSVPSIDIINKINMDKGLFSRTLKALIADEFVTAVTDNSDQRRQLLSLTAKGAGRYDNVIAIMRKRQNYLLHDVTESERVALFSALNKLAINAQRKDF